MPVAGTLGGITNWSGNKASIMKFSYIIISVTLLFFSIAIMGCGPRIPGEFITFEGHADPVVSLAISTDNKTLISKSNRHELKIWNLDIDPHRENVILDERKALRDQPVSQYGAVAISPDGTTIAAGRSGAAAVLWDSSTLQVRSTFQWPGNTGVDQLGYGCYSVDYGLSVAFAPNDNILAVGSKHGYVSIWEIDSGEMIRNFNKHNASIMIIKYNHGADMLASGGIDGTVRLWNPKTDEEHAVFRGHARGVLTLDFAPDGGILASGSLDRSIKLWNTTTGQIVADLKRHRHPLLCVVFSPSGDLLASSDAGGTIVLWDANTLEVLAKMSMRDNRINSILFAYDGKMLLCGCQDGTIRLWDLRQVKQ